MDKLVAQAQQVIALAGPLWLWAMIAAFAVMVMESAKPGREQGEPKPEGDMLSVVAAILSLAVPVLLFIHAYINAAKAQLDGAFLATMIVVGAVVIAAALLGWIIAAAAKPLGHMLGRIAPIIAVIVFAFTLSVTWENAYEVFRIQVLERF